LRKFVIIALIAGTFLVTPVLSAPAQGTTMAKSAAVKADAPKRFGLTFNLLGPQGGMLDFSDGYQFGAGGKLWLSDILAIRALTGMYMHIPVAGANETYLSVGAGIEFHASGEVVSPYAAAIVGVGLESNSGASETSLQVGAAGGAELKMTDNLSLFGEFQVKLVVSPVGTTIVIADTRSPSSGAVFGVILYF
jgi:hypothetical protein